jgi:hypothetical protein
VPVIPEDNVDVVIVNDVGATANTSATDLVCAGLPPSTTVAVK